MSRTKCAALTAVAVLGCLLASGTLAKERVVTLVAVGDVNLNRHREVVKPDGMVVWGKLVPFDEPLHRIAPYIDGDINFCNLETTVMDRNDVPPADKTYNFRTHPNAVRALLKLGFNLMTLANNHIIDYGEEGVKETLKWMATLKKEVRKERLWYAGVGLDAEEATEPVVFKVRGVRFAFVGVSISKPAGKSSYGVASVHNPTKALEKLKAADADVRILSMHAGEETVSKPAGVQFKVAREAIDKYDVDIVLGHHAHVPQGVEFYKNGLIFFGLGNFSMRGAANMGQAKYRNVRDFGLLVKVEMAWDTESKKLTFRRVDALPVYDMHSGVRAFAKDDEAKARIASLNELSAPAMLGKNSGGLLFEFHGGRGVAKFGEGKPLAFAAEGTRGSLASQEAEGKKTDTKKDDKKQVLDRKKDKKEDKKSKRKTDKKRKHRKSKDKKKSTSHDEVRPLPYIALSNVAL